MRPAISLLKSKNFQLFVKKKFSLLYPDRGIVPRSGYIPRSVPFSSLFIVPHIKITVYAKMMPAVILSTITSPRIHYTFDVFLELAEKLVRLPIAQRCSCLYCNRSAVALYLLLYLIQSPKLGGQSRQLLSSYKL